MLLVYFSGVSEFTHRFVGKLGAESRRIPLSGEDLLITEPYVLLTPTYATTKRAVPPQVVRFLNVESNRALLRGVVGSGNTNFNKDYCLAAEMIARKCGVPLHHKLELLGTPEDVEIVRNLLKSGDRPQRRMERP